MKELKQIIQAFELACGNGQKAALATVVHVEGSSYRGPGARMLITEDGMLTGAISGGCLEGDALRKALTVMMQGKPLLATYDTSDEDDAVIGVGLGCNGIIRVLIEPLNPEDEINPVTLLQQVVQKRQAAVLVTFFSLDNKWNPQQGTRLLLRANEEALQTGPVPADLHAVLKDAKEAFNTKAPAFIQYPAGNTAFIEYMAPPVSLVIAGAGNDVFPLVQISEVLGWDVTLIDGRPGYANARRFPDCRLIVSDPESALQKLIIDDQTAVVLMTHNYNYDKAMLKALSALPVNYIGVLGPKKKFIRIQSELAEEGIKLTDDIYSPVGLDIGAETADEIALSIAAEIKAVFAGKSGVTLRSIKGGIHHRDTAIIASSGHSCGIVILAAGTSRRLGTPKQLLQFNGDSLLNNAIKTAKQVNATAAVVVLGAEADALQHAIKDAETPVILNMQFEEGMASSIRCGVQYMMDHGKTDHIILMVCDQPHVDAAHILALIDKQRATDAKIVASFYADRKGVPALFHKSLFPELLALTGDVGARRIIEKYHADTVVVPFPLGVVDIDTDEAYRALVT